MASLKDTIIFVTILLFIYNALFTYIIINITTGTNRLMFLVLIAVDYIIIFYFMSHMAHEMKASKPKGTTKRRRRR